MTIQLNTASLVRLLEKLLAERLVRYGRVHALSYDPTGRALKLLILPLGEKQLVSVELLGCALVRQGGQTHLKASSVRANRLWLQQLLADHIDRFDLVVPSFLLGVVESILKEG